MWRQRAHVDRGVLVPHDDADTKVAQDLGEVAEPGRPLGLVGPPAGRQGGHQRRRPPTRAPACPPAPAWRRRLFDRSRSRSTLRRTPHWSRTSNVPLLPPDDSPRQGDKLARSTNHSHPSEEARSSATGCMLTTRFLRRGTDRDSVKTRMDRRRVGWRIARGPRLGRVQLDRAKPNVRIRRQALGLDSSGSVASSSIRAVRADVRRR